MLFLSFAWFVVAIVGALYITVCRPRHTLLTPRQFYYTAIGRWEVRKYTPNLYKTAKQDFLVFLVLLCLPLYLNVPVAGRIGCAIWAGLFFTWAWSILNRVVVRRPFLGTACIMFGSVFSLLVINPAFVQGIELLLGMASVLMGLHVFAVDRAIERAEKRAPARL